MSEKSGFADRFAGRIRVISKAVASDVLKVDDKKIIKYVWKVSINY